MWHDKTPLTKLLARILLVTWNVDIANEDGRRRERDRGRIAEYFDDIINLLQVMGLSDKDHNVEEFISLL